jgi:hypothetical protein
MQPLARVGFVLSFFASVACVDRAHAQAVQAGAPSGSSDVARTVGLGLDTSKVQRGATALPTEVPTEEEEGEELQMSSTGFVRVPGRLSIGRSQNVDPGVERGMKTHAPPIIPDDNYNDWRYLNNMYTPWAEVRFSYGNRTATATVAIAAFDITDASYRNTQAQLGINEAFVTLNLPRLFGPRGGIVWNVGAFQNGYGTAGQYDTGKYDTYLFGATHAAGETLAAFYDLTPDWTVRAEHGFGVKIDMPQFAVDYTQEDHERDGNSPYLPYNGPVQPGGTMVHHGHVGVTWKGMLTMAGHALTSFTDDARRGTNFEGQIEQDARITVLGGELKLVGSTIGTGFIGYAHLISEAPLREAGALETIHAVGGYTLRDAYFDNGQNPESPATGSGTIDTVMFQHTFSVSTFLQGTENFWGQGPDLLLSAFAMYNHVASNDPLFTGGRNKLKYGAEAAYVPLKWLGTGARFDVVQPDLKDNTQSFSVFSPKLMLRSSYVSREEIQLQYSYYRYAKNVSPPWPNDVVETAGGGTARQKPDAHALMLSASMWW